MNITKPQPPSLRIATKRWSRERKLAKLKELEAMESALEQKLTEVVEADPFWHFKPTTGTLTPEGRKLLEEFLKPEDIPLIFQSQTDVFASTAPIRLVGGGNQSGKTTSGAIESFIQLTGEIPPGLQGIFPESKIPKKYPFFIRVIGEDYENGIIQNLLPTYRKWCPKAYLIGGDWDKSFASGNGVLTLVYKGRIRGTIEFMSNKQEPGSFQGPPRHKMVYDEEPREDIFAENLFRFVTSDRLDIMINMTPTKGLTWVAEQIAGEDTLDVQTAQADIECFEISTVINPKANLKVVRTILKHVMSYSEILMRVLGKFVSLSGRIYGDVFNPRVHVIQPFPIKKSEMVVFRGIDPHLSKPSVAVMVGCDREENLYVLTTLKRQCDTQEFKDQLALASKDYRLAWSAIDQSSDATAHAFSERNIYRELTTGPNYIRAVRKSYKYDGSIKAGVDAIKQALRNSLKIKGLQEPSKETKDTLVLSPSQNVEGPKLWIFNVPENAELIRSFRNLEREKHRDEDIRGKRDKIAEGKHDAHACLRYIFQHQVHYISSDNESTPQYEPDSEDGSY